MNVQEGSRGHVGASSHPRHRRSESGRTRLDRGRLPAPWGGVQSRLGGLRGCAEPRQRAGEARCVLAKRTAALCHPVGSSREPGAGPGTPTPPRQCRWGESRRRWGSRDSVPRGWHPMGPPGRMWAQARACPAVPSGDATCLLAHAQLHGLSGPHHPGTWSPKAGPLSGDSSRRHILSSVRGGTEQTRTLQQTSHEASCARGKSFILPPEICPFQLILKSP